MAATTDQALFELPLKALHEAAGARFGGFAGWNMPITYPLGVLKEHLHTRDKAGLFDISHMKLILVTGREAAKALARACPLDPAALVMSHVSINFDRTGFQRDPNVVYPIDPLRELAMRGTIGAVAPTHFSVMGSTDPRTMEGTADQIVGQARQDRTDAVLLVPV